MDAIQPVEPLAAAGQQTAAARVILKPRKALPFYGRHPWVLDSAVDRIERAAEHDEQSLDGQVVELVNDKGRFIARGLFNSHSRICVRLYTWQAEEALDEAFFRAKLQSAIELRRQIGYEPPPDADGRSETATRLVFSEADHFSGLIVDRYGDYLVVQPTALGIALRLDEFVASLQEALRPRGIVLKLDPATVALEGMSSDDERSFAGVRRGGEPQPRLRETQPPSATSQFPYADGHAWGDLPEGPLQIREHGLIYEVDLHGGQKTGFYLDQRENRLAGSRYMRGRRVLDMFCYTGGFGLTAAALGGASEVLGIDGSKRAIAQAQRNAEINGLQNVQFEYGDAFKTLDRLIEQGEKFDAVILDPPKFARGRGGANQALMAYHRLNKAAVALLQRGGILLTCSCTGGVSREDFLLMLSGVAQKSGRDIRVIEQRGAAADHPVSATCLETEYLKCMICEIQ
jgi:23S rRNA (cytosine1962-C5)-methyltransferase